jgi:predicted ferric reductase
VASVTSERAAAGNAYGDRRSSRKAHRRPASRPGPAPRPRAVDVALAIVGLGFGATLAVGLTSETWAGLRAPGGVAMFLGNMTGLAGTYLALVMVLLVSRVPIVERVLGQDGLLRWHRKLSVWPISLIVAHAVLLTYAYAEATRTGFMHQIGSFISSYSGMLIAIIGFGVMVVISVLSIHSIRRRLRRETWWALHLGMYLAFALAFLHEVALGPSFVGHPLTEAVWSAAWAATAGVVLVYRFGLPIARTLRYDLRVAEVRHEVDGVTSIICKGRHLDRLAISGGQFFEWRFLAPGMWWQAHPYSLSARPRPPYLRLTVKAVGDHSLAVTSLAPGTRVAVEGPYGAFTAHARRRHKAVFIAGGIGVTAARSLLEDLPKRSEPVVLWRVSRYEDAALAGEVQDLVTQLRGKLHVLAGPRDEFPLQKLVKLVPDIRQRDVFVSGSEGFVESVMEVLSYQGVPREAIHHEAYAL